MEASFERISIAGTGAYKLRMQANICDLSKDKGGEKSVYQRVHPIDQIRVFKSCDEITTNNLRVVIKLKEDQILWAVYQPHFLTNLEVERNAHHFVLINSHWSKHKFFRLLQNGIKCLSLYVYFLLEIV